jgi:hypothetical protein
VGQDVAFWTLTWSRFWGTKSKGPAVKRVNIDYRI